MNCRIIVMKFSEVKKKTGYVRIDVSPRHEMKG